MENSNYQGGDSLQATVFTTLWVTTLLLIKLHQPLTDLLLARACAAAAALLEAVLRIATQRRPPPHGQVSVGKFGDVWKSVHSGSVNTPRLLLTCPFLVRATLQGCEGGPGTGDEDRRAGTS